MIDFYFIGGDFLSYKDTCKIIKTFGVIPEENPNEIMLRRLQDIISRCMLHYTPEKGELTLRGVYLYRESDQAGDMRNTYGNTQYINEHDALIGLSYGLLQYNMPVFHDLVFLHEASHLYEISHNEDFQNRFNDVEFNYYFYNNVRADEGARPKPRRKGWRM